MANRKTNGGASNVAERNTVGQKIQRELEKPELPSKTRAAGEKTVTVTFNVTVPESTRALKRSVFLAGTLRQVNKNLADWDTRAQQMKKVDDRHWTISFTAPEGATIEYKYTLGDWDHVERDGGCHDIANRQVTLTRPAKEPLIINDTVYTWRQVSPCGW